MKVWSVVPSGFRRATRLRTAPSVVVNRPAMRILPSGWTAVARTIRLMVDPPSNEKSTSPACAALTVSPAPALVTEPNALLTSTL